MHFLLITLFFTTVVHIYNHILVHSLVSQKRIVLPFVFVAPLVTKIQGFGITTTSNDTVHKFSRLVLDRCTAIFCPQV